jgi:hypothetical protein
MDVICSERDCRRAATATKAVRLREGRDKSKMISIWVCDRHLDAEGAVPVKGRMFGEATASRGAAT